MLELLYLRVQAPDSSVLEFSLPSLFDLAHHEVIQAKSHMARSGPQHLQGHGFLLNQIYAKADIVISHFYSCSAVLQQKAMPKQWRARCGEIQ